ncbi:MAG: nucleotidyltransferase family protein [Clostridia bacterium]|nr:nucleotidyltransferase family protein [Clostridia bacterium]
MTDVSLLYLGRLSAAALDGKEAPAAPEGVSWRALLNVAHRARVDSVITPLILTFPRGTLPEKYIKRLETERNDALSIEIQRQFEAEKVTGALTASGIKVCPLKGAVLKELYPSPETRSMGDLDYFVSPARACRAVMKGLGFERKRVFASHHDEYESAAYPLGVELHKNPVSSENPAYEYYKDFEKRMRPTEKENLYALSREDLYIFNTAHFYYDFASVGCSLRPLFDMRVLKARGLDREYIEKELAKIGVLEFEKLMSRISNAFFDGGEWDEETESVFSALCENGVYGGVKTRIKNFTEKEGGKGKYITERLFPPLSNVRRQSRAIDACPPLIVFYWGYRAAAAALTKSGKIKYELSALKDEKTDRKE